MHDSERQKILNCEAGFQIHLTEGVYILILLDKFTWVNR